MPGLQHRRAGGDLPAQAQWDQLQRWQCLYHRGDLHQRHLWRRQFELPQAPPPSVRVATSAWAARLEHPLPHRFCAGNGSCQPGTGDTACGTSGLCINCGTGRRCVNGSCVCDSTSCENGCCDANNQCQVNNNLTCGMSGVSCSTTTSCPDSQVCSSGVCTACSVACAGCFFCAQQANGNWQCGVNPKGNDCEGVCTTSSTCGSNVCLKGWTFTSSNSFQPLSNGCSKPDGTALCGNFTACP